MLPLRINADECIIRNLSIVLLRILFLAFHSDICNIPFEELA